MSLGGVVHDCPVQSTVLQPLSSCRATGLNCLTLNNLTDEPLLLQGGANLCGHVPLRAQNVFYGVSSGSCWTVTGAQSGNVYVRNFCVYAPETLNITPLPPELPDYDCNTQNTKVWFLLGAAWVVGAIALVFVILRLRRAADRVNAFCVHNPLNATCATPASVPGATLLGVLAAGSATAGVAFTVTGLTVAGRVPWQKITCAECHARGNLWAWTLPYNSSSTLRKNLCSKFGICQCRSAYYESQCRAFGQTIMPAAVYDNSVAQKPSGYDCACTNQVTGQRYNCGISVLGGAPCATCSSTPKQK